MKLSITIPALLAAFGLTACDRPTVVTVPMKLYTLYAPPNHRDGVVHPTRADAEADREHFDGKTSE